MLIGFLCFFCSQHFRKDYNHMSLTTWNFSIKTSEVISFRWVLQAGPVVLHESVHSKSERSCKLFSIHRSWLTVALQKSNISWQRVATQQTARLVCMLQTVTKSDYTTTQPYKSWMVLSKSRISIGSTPLPSLPKLRWNVPFETLSD